MREPDPRSRRVTSCPSRSGRPISSTIRSNSPGRGGTERFWPGVDDSRREPGRLETLLEERGDALLVFGDEDAGHAVPSVCAAVGRVAGRTIVNVAPCPGLESTVTRPPWASAMLATIARPRPEPPGPRPRVAEPRWKRWKIRCWSSIRMPGPKSRTQSRTVSSLPLDPPSPPSRSALPISMRPRPGFPVCDGVRGELQHRLRDPVRVQRRDALRARRDHPLLVGQGGGLRMDAVRQLREIDRPDRQAPDIAAVGQSGDLGHEAGHPVHLVDDEPAGCAHVGRIVLVDHFEVSAHDRERRLQLVPDVAEQLSLGGHRAVEAVEHPVDRTGELRDVVVADHRDAFAQVGRGDPVGRVRQRTDGAQQAAGDEPAHDPHDQERDGCDDRVGGERIRQRLKLRGQVDGDDEDAAPAVGRHADRRCDVAQGPPIRARGDGAPNDRARPGLGYDPRHQVRVLVESEVDAPAWRERGFAVDDRETRLVGARAQLLDDRRHHGVEGGGSGVGRDLPGVSDERLEPVIRRHEHALALQQVGRRARDDHAERRDEQQCREDAHPHRDEHLLIIDWRPACRRVPGVRILLPGRGWDRDSSDGRMNARTIYCWIRSIELPSIEPGGTGMHYSRGTKCSSGIWVGPASRSRRSPTATG